MIKLIMTCAKLAIISIIVLILAQVSISGRRIADHVWDMTNHRHVQTPIRWIADKFSFIEGHKIKKDGQAQDKDREEDNTIAASSSSDNRRKLSRTANSAYSDSDRERLSGMLKRPSH